MDNPIRNSAVKVLTHYFRELHRRAGAPWSCDAEVELAGVVDDIIAAALIEVARAGAAGLITEHGAAVATLIKGKT